MENNNYPLEIRDVEPEMAEMLMKYFTGKYLFILITPIPTSHIEDNGHLL